MINLLDRNQIISHLVNKSERHPALSEIAKFISLSIFIRNFMKHIYIHILWVKKKLCLLYIPLFLIQGASKRKNVSVSKFN